MNKQSEPRTGREEREMANKRAIKMKQVSGEMGDDVRVQPNQHLSYIMENAQN